MLSSLCLRRFCRVALTTASVSAASREDFRSRSAGGEAPPPAAFSRMSSMSSWPVFFSLAESSSSEPGGTPQVAGAGRCEASGEAAAASAASAGSAASGSVRAGPLIPQTLPTEFRAES